MFLLSSSPLRVSLFGSSTDYNSWSDIHGGISVNFTINKYVYVSIKELLPFFSYKSSFSYSKIERVNDHSDIEHNVIRECLKQFRVDTGVDFIHQSDLFSGCGLGSSSAFTVCVINAINSWLHNHLSKEKLAELSINMEQNILRENVGKQDVLASVYGGFNVFRYLKNGKIVREPIYLSRSFSNYLISCSMLFYTGVSRRANDVAGKYVNLLVEKTAQQLLLMELAEAGVAALKSEDFNKIVNLLNETWRVKKTISEEIETPTVKLIHDLVSTHDSVGFKLCGAGGGGVIYCIAPPKFRVMIRQNLLSLGLVEIPFDFEYNGSRVIRP